MANEIISNIIAILVAIGLFLSFRLSKMLKHIIYGSFLIAMGGINILSYYEATTLAIPDMPVLVYVLNIVVAVSGGSLIFEGIKEDSIMKIPTILIGATIVTLSVVPTLHRLNAITFNIPTYPSIINSFIHLTAGLFLLLAIFIVGD